MFQIFKRYLWLSAIIVVTAFDFFFWSQGKIVFRLTTLPLLIPLFMGLFWHTIKANRSLFLALVFCWIGDWLLLFDANHILQILSVSSYLLAQFLFIESLLKRIRWFTPAAFMMGVLFFGAYLIVFFSNIYAYLGDMKFIGLAYGFTLSFLGCLTIMRFFQQPSWQRFSLFLGVLLFSGRDVMLTYNKYYFKFDYFVIGIVLFYSLALYLIVRYFDQVKALPLAEKKGVLEID